MSALDNFKSSPVGKRLRPIVEDRENIRDMIALSRIDTPAVKAVDKAVAALGKRALDNTAKQMVGRWIRELLAEEGWTPLRSGRVNGKVFSTGAIYTPTPA